MADERVVVRHLGISFDAGASGSQSVIQRHFAGVIAVRMAGYWCYVAAEVGRVYGHHLGK